MKRYVGPLVEEEAAPQPPVEGRVAFTAPFLLSDNFMGPGDAAAMREGIDAHFAEPHKHSADRHQVWNYWYVPGLYTYLRTAPEKVIEPALVRRFHQALSAWARETLGLTHVTWPYLSLYVDGCQQSLHNDSTNGRFGYVFSLTRNQRRTTGGETMLLREGDLFRSNMGRAAAGRGLVELIEPWFNRLALFDDRMPHGVQRVEGSMDPVEGRFVLHGHISEGGPFAEGPLDAGEVTAGIHAALAPLTAELRQSGAVHHGPLVLRLTIDRSGFVSRLDTLVDRVARSDGAATAAELGRLRATVSRLPFPPAPAPTVATVPLMFGGDLPWMAGRG